MSAVFAVILLTLLALPGDSLAQPRPVTEVVYGLSAFDGEGYSPVFAPQAARTIYLLEWAPNIVVARRTQVYFWPLTEQYLPDWAALNEELFLGLRLLEGIDIADVERRYNVSLLKRLEALRREGLLTIEGSRARLAPGRLAVSNEVFVELLA